MKNSYIYSIAGILVVIAIGAFVYSAQPAAPASPQTPDIEQPVKTETSGTLEAHMGTPAAVLGVTITPTKIVEDSRCPSDVQCIQAGTVRVETHLSDGSGTGTMSTSTQLFVLSQPVTTEAETITLIDVLPVKTSKVSLTPSQYRFVFRVEKR